MPKVLVRSGFPFNYDQDAASEESGLKCEDKSLALQSQAEDADINVLVRRFGISGTFPVPARLPVFEDFSNIFDFRTAMDAVREAEASFMAVPADIRRRFGNDPQEFVAFCSDPQNQDELVKLGLAVRRPDPSVELEKEVDRELAKDSIRDKKRATSAQGGDKK